MEDDRRIKEGRLCTMKLSHSKLNCILNCPMTYYLYYYQKMYKKEKKPALWIGSAVHHGLEIGSEDLSEYFKKEGTFKQGQSYTREQILCEAMVHGYLKHKEEIFNEILSYKNERLSLIEEYHELTITAPLKSTIGADHSFLGIVDLLLLTDKGFIIIDYKTSTREPDWDGYLDQLYRYIFLLQSEFPEVPILKIGIVNIKKTAIRQKKNESDEDFTRRMKYEYDINDERLVCYHEFDVQDINKEHMKNYIDNLSKMADFAQTIDDKKLWYINFAAAKGDYGKSDFYDIFYHTPDAYIFYGIEDEIYSEEEKKIVTWRDCVPIDMLVCEHSNVLNKYSIFKDEHSSYDFDESFSFEISKKEFEEYLKSKYIVDESLLQRYWKTLELQLSSNLISD